MRCKTIKSLVMLILPALIVMVIVGCGQTADGNHPLMIRAADQIRIQKYDDAVMSLKQYLKVNPDSARAHQLLAQLYDENLDKPELAVYHYMLCLEVNPHIQGASDIKKFLASARKRAYNRLKKEYNDSKTVSDLSDKLDLSRSKQQALELKNKRLGQVVVAYKHHIFKLNSEQRNLKLQLEAAKAAKEITVGKITAQENLLAENKKELESLKNELNKLRGKTENPPVPENVVAPGSNPENTALVPVKDAMAESSAEKKAESPVADSKPEKLEKPVTPTPPIPPLDKKVEAEAVTVPAAAVPEKTQAKKFPDIALVNEKTETENKNRLYTVKQGDTLSSISREFYGSARHYNVILGANKDILPNAARLKPGQELKIPPLPVQENKKH